MEQSEFEAYGIRVFSLAQPCCQPVGTTLLKVCPLCPTPQDPEEGLGETLRVSLHVTVYIP
jgi:hypothetical protein